MARIQLHRFVDLAKPTRTAAERALELDRRGFLGAAAGIAAATGMSAEAFARNFGPEAEPQRYPDPDILVLDKRFSAKVGNTTIHRHHTGTLWAEGPAWSQVGRYLVWSDIPNDRQLRWLEEDGHVSERFRFPSNGANGNTFDYQGRQLTCERTRVVRFENGWRPDPKNLVPHLTTVLADKADDGQPLNGPNDLVVHPDDGAIWFTDPGYGAINLYEGEHVRNGSSSPLRKEAIYRIDAQSGKISKVADEPFKPNGLAFSHDYKKLYVADTGITHYPQAKSIVWQYDIEGTSLRNPRTFCSMEYEGRTGFGDGMRVDVDGNLWVGTGWAGEGYDGVHVFAPDGQRIGLIRMPEIVANVCFGGAKRNRLFMAGSQSLYSVYVETQGAHIS